MSTTDDLVHVTGETVFDSEDIKELLRAVEVAMHNMWVDARTHDEQTGNYSRVDVDVEITVRKRETDS